MDLHKKLQKNRAGTRATAQARRALEPSMSLSFNLRLTDVNVVDKLLTWIKTMRFKGSW